MLINKKHYVHKITTRTKKTGIVIHGTGGGSVDGAVSSFSSLGVSVPFIIDREGNIFQLYDEAFDHWHAGANFRGISKKTIGIELVNFNHLTMKNSKYYNYLGKQINPNEVFVSESVWRGYKAFHNVPEAQLQALCYLLKMLCEKHGIKKSLTRNFDPLKIKSIEWSGICFHSTFHSSKMDFQPDVIGKILI